MILNELRPLTAPSPDEVGCRSRQNIYAPVWMLSKLSVRFSRFHASFLFSMVFLLSRLFCKAKSQLLGINFSQCWRAFEWIV